MELHDTGGFYRFSNVTYRGMQIGTVTAVGPTATGAKAKLQLDTSPKINLLAQGLPPDDRAGIEDRTFGPVDGTPSPGAAPAGTPPGPPAPRSLNQPPTAPQVGAAPTAPNAFNSNSSGVSPSVAVLHYDPRTGRYVAPDGQMYRQSDLVRSKVAKSWKDMLISSACRRVSWRN